MKAIAVHPGVPDSMHLTDAPEPSVDDVSDGRGVLVEVLRVGVDGTDKEINAAEYGAAPTGDDYLITGHESLGRVVETGPNVPDSLKAGTYVVATVRRPGSSPYDAIGLQDMTTDDTYYERGINLLHGYLAERYVDDYRYIVPLPDTLRGVGVLLEPLTVAEKGIYQAQEIQRRLRIWQPRRAAVLGAGTIGLLATLALRLRGLEVVLYSRREPPYLNSELAEQLGAVYISSNERPLADVASEHGPLDLIIEATGFSPLVFEAADVLGKNGVLVLASVTGGDREVEVPADRINQGFVLGNKVMVGTVNASRGDFELGVDDLVKAEAFYSGWLGRLLTTPVDGLENWAEMLERLTEDREAIKVFVEVAPDEGSAKRAGARTAARRSAEVVVERRAHT
jgi:glucose 1-dehydrogenase